MPEMRFKVRWPDDTISNCYSPSTVVREHLTVGQRYPLTEFVERSRTALKLASERVREKYGYACSSARDQVRQIEMTARRFDDREDASVVVESFHP